MAAVEALAVTQACSFAWGHFGVAGMDGKGWKVKEKWGGKWKDV
jgi:hypothetical protein